MSNGPAIVIDVTREDWPGGPRTLTPLDPNEEPNRQTTWFGAELASVGNQMWFRITLEAVHRIQEKTPSVPGGPLQLLTLFTALCRRHPGRIQPGQPRTLQRRVRERRV